jgi:bifunctional enzyme CysN/CysC
VPEQELLRFVTAGSVDDGKSTLIGRLLHDTTSILEDELASMSAASSQAGRLDFALITDGLLAEREQGITIDVAYRYFATAWRRFIVADAPGHEQYTRNMATGASTATLAVILIDSRKGVLTQTRRHAIIAWLLGIRRIAVVINKMDLVHFDQAIFRKHTVDLGEFLTNLPEMEACCFPICSTDGDNIVHRSSRMPWYDGPTLLGHLETVPCDMNDHAEAALRFPVQYVIRSSERRYAGQLASGTLRCGDRVRVLPSGADTIITSLRIADREVDSARAPVSITVALENDLDVGRGDMFVDAAHSPSVSRRFEATLLWMNEKPLEPGHAYLLKHTTRQVCARITRLKAVVDPVTLDRRPAAALRSNEFGEVEIETHQPLYFDPYTENRATGGFMLIDPLGNATVAAGMIRADLPSSATLGSWPVGGLTVWFTGLSSAGKSTISGAVYEKLWAMGHRVEWLDGDVVRQHLSKGLGFSKEDRDENIRRIGFVAELLTRNGVIALVSAISPYRSVRDELRQRIEHFVEVFVHAPLEICEQRDLKDIYRRARLGELHGVTGIDDPYEPPLTPEVECRTDRETPGESVSRVLAVIQDWLARHGG